MKKRGIQMQFIVSLLLLLLAVSGCAHVISEQTRSEVDRTVNDGLLFDNPNDYKGKIVILGGTIVSSRNEKDASYVEVLQKRLDRWGRPVQKDDSLGRFMIVHEGFLDTEIYSAGREITAAGVVEGTMKGSLGEMEYEYLLIRAKELYIHSGDRRSRFYFSIGVLQTF